MNFEATLGAPRRHASTRRDAQLVLRYSAAALAVSALLGCAAPGAPVLKPWYQSPARASGSAEVAGATHVAVEQTTPTPKLTSDVPSSLSFAPLQRAGSNAPPTKEVVADSGAANVSAADAITVNFDQLSLPAFIQTVYASILKRPVSVDPIVAARTDLVTFRASKPMSGADLSRFSRQLLKSYGVSVQDFDGLVRFTPDSGTTAYSPQVRRGRAQPDVPAQLRPIFQLLELDVVRTSEVSSWLRTMFGTKIQVTDDNFRWGVMISGQPDDVAAAVEVAQLLDQPALRGSQSIRLTPANWPADEFVRRLSDVLSAQGINTSNSGGSPAAVTLLPIAPLNAVFVFTASDDVLQHVVKWAQELDRSTANTSAGGLFSYNVKHTDAASLARVFGAVLGAAVPAAAPIGQNTAAFGGALQSGAARPVGALSTPGGVRIVVNPATNSLIIQGGKVEDYRQWSQLLAELDRPTKSALIEVVVAELTMSNNSSLGIEWALQDMLRRNGGASVGTLGGLSVPTSGGLSLVFRDSARQVRGLINALATDSNARILSSPKIVAKNGESATIQVGKEVPVITSQQSGGGSSGFGAFGGSSGQSGILQSIQYRSTGVILKVKPVIHSNNRLDLEVSQEVSDAASTQTGVSASPTISSRKIDTRLSMRDGSTVLLAGLISDSQSGSDSGVPFAKDIPGIGALFKNQSKNGSRTELVVLITSYIINDDFEAESITDAFRNSLGTWANDAVRVTRPAGLSTRAADTSSIIAAPTVSPAPVMQIAPTVPSLPMRTRVEPSGAMLSNPGRATNPAASDVPVLPGSSSPRPSAAPPVPVKDPDVIKELEALRQRGAGK